MLQLLDSVLLTHEQLTNNPDLLFAVDRERFCDFEFQALVMIKYTYLPYKDILAYEEEVYKALKGIEGFPLLRWSGAWGDTFCIVMDYMGCNFESLKYYYPDVFDSETVAVFAVQMVSFMPF